MLADAAGHEMVSGIAWHMTTGSGDSPGSRLRTLMDNGCVMAPGAFNGLAARVIAQLGFDACYVSGAATSVCAGVPDVGLLTLDHFTRVVREVADGSCLPVLADADTGFGEEEMVRRTVIEYARAGAAGLHIEDQIFPKRCGHLDGKTLIPVHQACSRIQWAVKAAQDVSGGTFVVCARTDARGVDGFDAAVERGKRYVDAGAAMIFPEGLVSEDEFARFANEFQPREHGPYLLANMTEFGKTPIISHERFAAMGYSVVIYPVTALRLAMGAVMHGLGLLKESGSVSSVIDRMHTRTALYDAIGYTPGEPWEFPTGQ